MRHQLTSNETDFRIWKVMDKKLEEKGQTMYFKFSKVNEVYSSLLAQVL